MQLKKNLAISETGFVFDPNTGESYSMNAVGMEIFDLLKNKKTPEEINKIMTEKYDVERNSFEQYFYDFTVVLKQMNLIDDSK